MLWESIPHNSTQDPFGKVSNPELQSTLRFSGFPREPNTPSKKRIDTLSYRVPYRDL